MNRNNFTPQDGLVVNISKINRHMLDNGIELKYTPYIVQLIGGKRFSSPQESLETTYLPANFNWFTAIEENSLCIITKNNNKETWQLKTLLKDFWNGKYKFM